MVYSRFLSHLTLNVTIDVKCHKLNVFCHNLTFFVANPTFFVTTLSVTLKSKTNAICHKIHILLMSPNFKSIPIWTDKKQCIYIFLSQDLLILWPCYLILSARSQFDSNFGLNMIFRTNILRYSSGMTYNSNFLNNYTIFLSVDKRTLIGCVGVISHLLIYQI